MMNHTQTRSPLVCTVLMLALGLLPGCDQQQTDSPPSMAGSAMENANVVRLPADSPMLQRIQLATAEQRQLPTESFTAPARIELDPRRAAAIRSPVPGRVQALLVEPGEEVVSGQALMRLDSAEVAAVLAEYRQAQAESRQAENELIRTRELFAIDAVARRQLQEAERDAEMAAAAREQAQQQLQYLGLSPGQSNQSLLVSSPLDGKVLDVAVSVGELVNDEEEVLMQVADLRQVLAVASVPERRVAMLAGSRAATLRTPAWPEREFSAEIVRTADVVDEDSRTVSVYLRLDNSESLLRPAMFGTVTLDSEPGPMVVVPAGTVIYRGSQPLVLVETGPGEFEIRQVIAAPLRGELQPILDGVSNGERVVTDGALLLLEQGRAS